MRPGAYQSAIAPPPAGRPLLVRPQGPALDRPAPGLAFAQRYTPSPRHRHRREQEQASWTSCKTSLVQDVRVHQKARGCEEHNAVCGTSVQERNLCRPTGVSSSRSPGRDARIRCLHLFGVRAVAAAPVRNGGLRRGHASRLPARIHAAAHRVGPKSTATKTLPSGSQSSHPSLRLDEDVLDWFRRSGPRYQTPMNAVLRMYVKRMSDRVSPIVLKVRGCTCDEPQHCY
jgi:uncharacterized protein (DUF4415 family)